MVGIQASVVHNSSVFLTSAGASPLEMYVTGVRFLEGGVPGEARRLISEAIAHGHDTIAARFHLLLALLSRRSDRDLNAEDREQLHSMSEPTPCDPNDEWTMPLIVVAATDEPMPEP